MNDPYSDLEPSDRGFVEHVNDIGTVHIRWDNASTLGAAYGEDVIKLVTVQMAVAIKEQISAIRSSGETNMVDGQTV